MLYPSVDSLKEKIDSKYILVTIASKRAREIQEEGINLLSHLIKQKKMWVKHLKKLLQVFCRKQVQDAVNYLRR